MRRSCAVRTFPCSLLPALLFLFVLLLGTGCWLCLRPLFLLLPVHATCVVHASFPRFLLPTPLVLLTALLARAAPKTPKFSGVVLLPWSAVHATAGCVQFACLHPWFTAFPPCLLPWFAVHAAVPGVHRGHDRHGRTGRGLPEEHHLQEPRYDTGEYDGRQVWRDHVDWFSRPTEVCPYWLSLPLFPLLSLHWSSCLLPALYSVQQIILSAFLLSALSSPPPCCRCERGAGRGARHQVAAATVLGGPGACSPVGLELRRSAQITEQRTHSCVSFTAFAALIIRSDSPDTEA